MWVLQLYLKRAGKHENLTGEGSAQCVGLLAKGIPFKNLYGQSNYLGLGMFV